MKIRVYNGSVTDPVKKDSTEAASTTNSAVLPEKVIWKNSKKNSVNNAKVRQAQLVCVDGYPSPTHITSLINDGDNAIITIQGSDDSIPSDKAFPLYISTDPAIIGDFVLIASADGQKYGVVKSGTGNSTKEFGVITANGSEKVPKEQILQVFSRKTPKIDADRFTCGKIKYNGKTYDSKEALEKAYKDTRFNLVSKSVSYEHHKISTHYNISEDKLRPKDHDIMEQLRKYLDHPLSVEAKEWALLVGPSGSGKTVAAIRYAEEKGREYIKIPCTAQMTVDDLVGYKSIVNGEYYSSLLRDAVENGKICILDEIDASNPNTLLVLNSLKSDKYQFPDALVDVHPEFRLLATANTLEYNEAYNGRQPMDKATRSRFKTIHYDMADYELALRYGLEYMKKIDYDARKDEPRDVERKIREIRIEEEQ